MLHTADCTILGAAAAGLCTGFPRTHLGPTVIQFIQLVLRGILPKMTASMFYCSHMHATSFGSGLYGNGKGT